MSGTAGGDALARIMEDNHQFSNNCYRFQPNWPMAMFKDNSPKTDTCFDNKCAIFGCPFFRQKTNFSGSLFVRSQTDNNFQCPFRRTTLQGIKFDLISCKKFEFLP